MFGVPMRNPEDQPLASAVEEAIKEQFEGERQAERQMAKEQINKIQSENRKSFDQKRKAANRYKPGDMVAICRTQFITGGKLTSDFMGPYRVTSVLDNDRYEVQRICDGPGPQKTTTAADLMKRWTRYDSSDEDDDEMTTSD